MTWLAVGVGGEMLGTALPYVAAGGAGFGLSKLFGGGKKKSAPSVPFPDFVEDPNYRKTQDYMQSLGIDILGGKIPDYYAGIGEPGGAEFENYLNMVSGDIQKSALDTAAATGRGGGAATEIASRAVGEATTQSRYADFLRALEGKKWLFGEGKDITEGVRTAGGNQGVIRNNFNLAKYNAAVGERGYQDSQDALSGQNWGQLLNLGVNAAGGFVSSGGNPMGAVAGAMGGFDWSSIFKKGGGATNTGAAVTGVSPATKLSKGSIDDIYTEILRNKRANL